MRTCIVCGCTDAMACHGGCAWQRKIGKDKGLCTNCPEPALAKHMTREQKIKRVELRGLVMVRNSKRREIARSYMSADRRYAEAVRRLRKFEAGIPL